MSTTTRPPARSAPPANRVRWPLSSPARKVVLMTHIISAGAWFGIDLVLCVLVVVGWLRPGSAARDEVWQPLATWYMLPMLYTTLAAGLVCLLSGLLLGFATKFGVLRYWWVAVKLVLNLVMTVVLLVFLLNPIQKISAGQAPVSELTIVFYLSVMALGMVTLASLISVFKPWGRIGTARQGTRS